MITSKKNLIALLEEIRGDGNSASISERLENAIANLASRRSGRQPVISDDVWQNAIDSIFPHLNGRISPSRLAKASRDHLVREGIYKSVPGEQTVILKLKKGLLRTPAIVDETTASGQPVKKGSGKLKKAIS